MFKYTHTIIFIFLSSIACSQSLTFLGKSYDDVLKSINKSKAFYEKEKWVKISKYNVIESLDTNSLNNKAKLIEIDVVVYTTPYRNFKYQYYFNHSGYCDSAIIYENACLDCAYTEDETSIRFPFEGVWKKESQHSFKSKDVYPILPRGKLYKSEKSAFIFLNREPMPADGVCRIWTATIKDELDAKKYRRYFYYRENLFQFRYMVALLSLFIIPLVADIVNSN